MKLFTSLRGPRLGTKLALLGLALLIVPWFSYRQLVEMEQLLIQGQSQAQLLTAEGISTLFNGRQDLFNDLPVDIEDFEPLFAHQLTNPIRLDGLTDDWGADLLKQRLAFTSTNPSGDGSFELLLGERADHCTHTCELRMTNWYLEILITCVWITLTTYVWNSSSPTPKTAASR